MTKSTNRSPQGKNWCFTLNNYSLLDDMAFQELDCRYIVFGREKGESGTLHLQGYICFNKNYTLNGLKTLQPRAHWEKAKGSHQQASDYCKKDGDFFQKGDMPKSRTQVGQDNKERWQAIIESAKRGTCEQDYPDSYLRYHNTIKKLYRPTLHSTDYSGVWYYGPPGTGKSLTARFYYPDYYLKSHNKWWDDYEKQPSVLIDDFDHNDKLMGSFLKNYADHYPFRGEHKGGSSMLRPKNIVVTSNYSIVDIFGDDLSLTAALERRFNQIYLGEPLTPEQKAFLLNPEQAIINMLQ